MYGSEYWSKEYVCIYKDFKTSIQVNKKGNRNAHIQGSAILANIVGQWAFRIFRLIRKGKIFVNYKKNKVISGKTLHAKEYDKFVNKIEGSCNLW